jgi:hypothetical protein
MHEAYTTDDTQMRSTLTITDAAPLTLLTMPPFSITPSAPTRHMSTPSMLAPTAASRITFVGMPRSENTRAASTLKHACGAR